MIMPQQKVKYPLDVHNTYWSSFDDAVSKDRASRSQVHPFIVPLIEAIQLKRPHWEFEATSTGNVHYKDGAGDTPVVLHSSFDVIDNGEKLGSIYREYRGSSNVYAAKSHRIANKRQIGTSKTSKHLKTIVSEVLKEMYPRTITEIADEKYKKSFEAMRQAAYKDQRTHMHAVDTMRNAMLTYLTTGGRWDEFEAVEDKPDVMKAKTSYRTLADNAGVAEDLAKSDHAVLIERPRDIVVKPDNGAAYACDLGVLPDDTKIKFALLKMGDIGTIVEGVGIRTGDDTFYILTKKEA